MSSASSKVRAALSGLALTAALAAAPLFAEISAPPPAAPLVSEPEPAQDQFQNYLDEGLMYFVDQADYARAAEYFRKALELNPKSPDARKALRLAREKMKKQAPSRPELEKREIEKARRYYQDGHYLFAILALKSVLDQNPDQEEARGFLQKIRGTVSALLAKEPSGSYQGWLYRGMVSYMEGRYEEAVTFWKRAATINSDNQIVALAVEQTEKEIRSGAQKKPALADESCDCELETPAPGAPPLGALPGVPSPAPVSVVPSAAPPPPPQLSAPLEDYPVPAGPQGPPILAAKPESLPPPVPEPQPKKPEPPPPTVSALPGLAEKPAPQEPEPSVVKDPDLERASEFLGRGNYVGAIGILQRVVLERPESGAAQELLQRALSEQRQSAARHYRLGMLHYLGGDYSAAVQEWQAVLKIDPNHPKAKKVILRAFFHQS